MPNEPLVRRSPPALAPRLQLRGLAQGLTAGLICVLSLALGACASTQGVEVQRETTQTFPATTLVQVLQQPPTQPFVRIAVLNAQAPAGTPLAQLLAQVQAKAAALGANAIVVQNLSQKVGGTLEYSPSGGQFSTTPSEIAPRLRAEAIRLEAPGKEEN